jgi:hypothetical protein
MIKFVCKVFVSFLFTSLCFSCVGLKTGKGGGVSSPSLVKMFNKGKDSLLCHAGPVEYSPVNCKDELEMDYTYLKVRGYSNPVTCNFSLISEDATIRPEKVMIDLNGQKTNVNQLEKFFAEGIDKKSYRYRYSFQVSDSVFYKWMQQEHPIITVNDRTFEGKKDFRKKSDVIFRSILFDLYN